MDQSDPLIQFDSAGRCNHCRRAQRLLEVIGSTDENRLDRWADEIRRSKAGTPHSSIIGLSGGVDSSYVALLLARLDIKPIVVHVDAGWNSAEAVSNIRRIVDTLNLDLETVVIDWKEMRNLQTAFLRSGIRNQDIPQDHAFFASLYRVASKYRIRNVITGANVATESILPRAWGSAAMDGKFLLSVARSQGLTRLDNFPISRLPRHYLLGMLLGRLTMHKPLDLIRYDKAAAKRELSSAVGWRDYGGKHRESLFTTWYQHIYLPRRFGIDKRKAHLSSLIVSGQTTRGLALSALGHPEVTQSEELILSRQVARKLGVDLRELDQLTRLPTVDEAMFDSDEWIHSRLIVQVGRLLLARGNQILRNVEATRSRTNRTS